MSKRGYVHLYVGDGKGKTTAATGLAVRAVYSDYRVAFFLFMKGRYSAEVEALIDLGALVDREWENDFCYKEPTLSQKYCVASQAARVVKAFEKRFDMVILDEILTAYSLGLISQDSVLKLIEAKPEDCELILTGREASASIIERADLVTVCKKIKHYFDKGAAARKGIEF